MYKKDKDLFDPMKYDQYGYLPMHYATINNQSESLKLLLQVYRCQPNATDLKNGMTCLHHASQLGFVSIVKLLTDHPDIDMVCILYIFELFFFSLTIIYN